MRRNRTQAAFALAVARTQLLSKDPVSGDGPNVIFNVMPGTLKVGARARPISDADHAPSNFLPYSVMAMASRSFLPLEVPLRKISISFGALVAPRRFIIVVTIQYFRLTIHSLMQQICDRELRDSACLYHPSHPGRERVKIMQSRPRGALATNWPVQWEARLHIEPVCSTVQDPDPAPRRLCRPQSSSRNPVPVIGI